MLRYKRLYFFSNFEKLFKLLEFSLLNAPLTQSTLLLPSLSNDPRSTQAWYTLREKVLFTSIAFRVLFSCELTLMVFLVFFFSQLWLTTLLNLLLLIFFSDLKKSFEKKKLFTFSSRRESHTFKNLTKDIFVLLVRRQSE